MRDNMLYGFPTGYDGTVILERLSEVLEFDPRSGLCTLAGAAFRHASIVLQLGSPM